MVRPYTSLERLHEEYIPEVRKFAPNVPYILVGLKQEATYDFETISKCRDKQSSPVTKEQAVAFAKLTQCACFIECSTFANYNVETVFELCFNLSCYDVFGSTTQQVEKKQCSIQ